MIQQLQLPPGYRFKPTDDQLVGHYLFNKLSDGLLPIDKMLVADSNLYDKDEPWHLWEKFGGDDEIYLFTPLKKKKSRILRSVGDNGTWHGVDSGKPVKAMTEGGQLIKGMKKTFNYRNPKSIHNGCWIMHEFSLFDVSSEWALCHLKKNFASDTDTDTDDVSVNGSEIEKRVSCKKRKIVGFDDVGGEKRLKTSEVVVIEHSNDIGETNAMTDVVIAQQHEELNSNWGSSVIVEESNQEFECWNDNNEWFDYSSSVINTDLACYADELLCDDPRLYADGDDIAETNRVGTDIVVAEQQEEVISALNANGASIVVAEVDNQVLEYSYDLAFSTDELLGDDQSFFADLQPLNQSDAYFAYLMEENGVPSVAEFGFSDIL